MGILDELLARQNETDQTGGMATPNTPEGNPAESQPVPFPTGPTAPPPKNPNFLRNLLTDFIGTLSGQLKSGRFQEAVGRGIQAGTARGGTPGQAFGASFGGLPQIQKENKQLELDNQLRQAQIGELIARGKAHGQQQVGKTPEELTLADLMTGNNGKPRINPETQQPYTWLEAFSKIKQTQQDVKPTPEKDRPLGADSININQAHTDQYQVLNPGKALPSQYVLTGKSTQGDFDRVNKTLEQTLHTQAAKISQDTGGKLPPEILAQVGKPPSPTNYRGGENDPKYIRDYAAWGAAAEKHKIMQAGATGEARGKGFGRNRPVQVLDTWNGNRPIIVSAADAEDNPNRYVTQSGGVAALAKEAQFSEMHVAAQKTREAINNLDKDFTTAQIGKLTLAMRKSDPGVFRTEIETLIGTQELTPKQEDFVVWVAQLNERALSLRNVAGMGQGSDQLRDAIRATLPGVKSGSKALALKQLDAFENQVMLLERGVPKVGGTQAGGAAPTGGIVSPADWLKNKKP